jgi:flagellar hook-associated protein 1 FlgK
LGVGDRSGAGDFINALSTATDLGRDGATSVQQLATKVLGETAGTASRAKERAEETGDRRSDATARRDSFSGVNLDEELGQLVVLQNSYSASARLISVANQMFDSLLGTIK